MIFGIEVEFAVKYCFNDPIGRNILVDLSYLGFSVTNDTSASSGTLQGYEIKNRIPFKKFNEKAFKEALSIIKLIGGRTTKTSGVHVHFSGGGVFSTAGKAVFTAELIKMKLCWRSRRQYCESFSGKYVPLNFISGDHYEVRSFNGTLNVHAIRNYLDVTNKLIKMAQKF